jgi:hypothetical protein
MPGAHFVGSDSESAGEVRKYKPDTFFIDDLVSATLAPSPRMRRKGTPVPGLSTRHVGNIHILLQAPYLLHLVDYVTGSYPHTDGAAVWRFWIP